MGRVKKRRERYYSNDQDVEKQKMTDFKNMFNFYSLVPYSFRDHKYNKDWMLITVLTMVVIIITMMILIMICEGCSVQTPSFLGS